MILPLEIERLKKPDGHRREMVPTDRTDSQPEAVKLLVVPMMTKLTGVTDYLL